MNTAHTTLSTLCERFLFHLRADPGAAAVISPDGAISFQTLSRMIAATQRAVTTARPRTVGLYSAPSPSLVAAAWSALFSGIAYVPLAPNYPDERIRYMIADGGIDLILVQPQRREDLEAIVADLDVTIIEIRTEHVDDIPAISATADCLAYVLYTSGSTGTPKGVEIAHSALTHQLRWIENELGLGPGTRIVHKTPISFDASQWELLANGTGATVVVGDPDAYRDPDALIDTVIEHRVTHLQVVPTLLQALCEDPKFVACTCIRVLASGGEALPARLATQAASILPAASVVNLYGPTETTINAARHRLDSSAPGSGTVAIGIPVDGLAFHLLDDRGDLIDSSSTGELAISGPQLANGYRNRPEETARRFITRTVEGAETRLYRTGDVVELVDGAYHFRGRTDSQVKIRGHRIELDEVRSALENHEWVRHAGVFTVDRDDNAGSQLTAYVELNPHEAALMDQGEHAAHHQSKATRVQVRAQIAGLGVREDHSAPGIELPVAPEADLLLHQLAFGRKTYRTFHSTTADIDLLTRLAETVSSPNEFSARYVGEWSFESLAFVLRSLVQYRSESRLLPKYAYASPGALYGVQVYARIAGVPALPDGVHYLNPVTANLHLVHPTSARGPRPTVELILVGQRSVITSVYRTNIDEVLAFEAGHLLGLLDATAPASGYRLGRRREQVEADPALIGNDTSDRFVLGSWPLIPGAQDDPDPLRDVRWRVELFTGGSDRRGVYESHEHHLERVSGSTLIRRKDVIAINQRVYDQASFGLVLTSTGTPQSYIDLGRALQRAQMNDLNIGLMSSGYSSSSGHDLATARRIHAFTGERGESSYFALGGPVTDDQIAHTGMDEDILHTQGPAEIITIDIAAMLPHYMLPDVIRITDSLPRSPNGKIDTRALHATETARQAERPIENYVAPASLLEHQLAQIWGETLEHDERVSTTTTFFALGGNSITAVRLVKTIRSRLGVALAVQSIFEHDTIVKQARALAAGGATDLSRAVPLAGTGPNPVFIWPGLGGYPMNLRGLAESITSPSGRIYGMQAFGLNDGEQVDDTVTTMAARDIAHLRRIQPHGPYNLIGYSFGARVAFEVAYQLETAGETVARLILLAPGSPTLAMEPATPDAHGPYRDPRFTRVLYSVFFGRTDGTHADDAIAAAKNRNSFLAAVAAEIAIDRGLAERITALVERTYSFEYTFTELLERRITAAITIIRASGDDYSFIDAAADAIRHTPITLDADHYQILRPPHLEHTADALVAALTRPTITELPKDTTRMPHVAIKHFPASFTDVELTAFVEQLSSLVCATFDVADSAVSISLESIHQENWQADVYQPEIVHRKHFLVKAPQY
ncbi:amino acid adenylation domain-containing protein [Nocardia sp. NBC_01377]|uniref:amino acid adenylation domain-containing protein n=1 Tax=Nocardia sp. NBC_01377 TaxID=2903595 RepID=UPI00324D2D62